MAPMLIDQWTSFAATPLATGIDWAIGLAFMAYLVALLTHQRAVPGSYRAFQGATMVKTLLWPVFAGYVYSALMALFTQNWVGALVDTWVCWTLVKDWEKFKDTDDWWKGKGTKLKKKLKSMFTVSSPAMAGAGA